MSADENKCCDTDCPDCPWKKDKSDKEDEVVKNPPNLKSQGPK